MRRLLEALATLQQVQREAEEARWQKPPTLMPEDKVTVARSEVSNPTYDIVADPRRMALSESCRDTEMFIAGMESAVIAEVKRLDHRLAQWRGDVVR